MCIEDAGMPIHSSLAMRLKIYLRRESYVWLRRRGETHLNFGWIISYRGSDNVLFKDDEHSRAVVIPIGEIESCGAV